MRLETNAVDGHTSRLDELDDANGAVGFDGEVFEVVIVVVELCTGVGSSGKLEGQGKVAVAEGLEEGIVAVFTVVLKGFVDDVPGVTFAFEVAHDVGDVRLDDRGHGVFGP